MIIKNKLMLLLLLMPLTSFAGFGEDFWRFDKGEQVIEDYSNHPYAFGTTLSCDAFSPKLVSFEIKFEGKIFPMITDYSGSGSITSTPQGYTIINASSLGLIFPAGGKYTVTNITNRAIEGINCGVGQF